MVHRLTKAQARRIAVRVQLLEATRPTDLASLVDRLTLLQLDPTAPIAPSADLVAWSHLGSSYRPEHLKARSSRTGRCSSSTPSCDRCAIWASTSPARPTGRPMLGLGPGCATTTASAATSSTGSRAPAR